MNGKSKELESQHSKFVRVAKELETDNSEKAFNALVKQIAKAPPPKDDKAKADK